MCDLCGKNKDLAFIINKTFKKSCPKNKCKRSIEHDHKVCNKCINDGKVFKKVNVFAKSAEEIIREIIEDRRPRNNSCIFS